MYIVTVLFQLRSKEDVIGLSPNSLDQGATPNNYINGTLFDLTLIVLMWRIG